VKEARSFIKTACSTFVDRKYKVCLSFFSLIFFFFIASSLARWLGGRNKARKGNERDIIALWIDSSFKFENFFKHRFSPSASLSIET